MALFPFGHGLSYTTFNIRPRSNPLRFPGGTTTVRFESVHGARQETVVSSTSATFRVLARPVMELKASSESAAPGEQRECRLRRSDELRMLDAACGGSSSPDLPHHGRRIVEGIRCAAS